MNHCEEVSVYGKTKTFFFGFESFVVLIPPFVICVGRMCSFESIRFFFIRNLFRDEGLKVLEFLASQGLKISYQFLDFGQIQ